MKGKIKCGGNKAAAEAIGRAIAERALAAGIKQVCFDRGSAKYHGRVAAVGRSRPQSRPQFLIATRINIFLQLARTEITRH